ncbi:hypothetical protein N7540_011590 [Penicillium herquei]|nr:hypothetical protein N7540_011590 [Penicillium herquei]
MELSNERLERIRDTFGSSAPWSLAREHAARLVGKTRVRLLAGSETPTAKANMELMCQILRELGIMNEMRQVPDAPHEYTDILEAIGEEGFAFWRDAFAA